jgi:hypothetical protein
MGQSRRVEADVVAHIAEVDERRLYAREAFPSMFAYCMDVLHLSEAEAYLRIWTAHASRKHPMLLTMLADGRLHLTGIVRLAPHLTLENRDRLLERATYRSKLPARATRRRSSAYRPPALLLPRAIFPRPSGVQCVIGTVIDAVTWTSTVDGARRVTASSSIIGDRSAWAATTTPRTLACSVARTMPTWPSATTAGTQWPGIGVCGAELPRPRPASLSIEPRRARAHTALRGT